MLLYHGTTATVADRAMREGLKPRALTGRSNYAAASHPDAVYLTDAYAPYFAFNTNDPKFSEGCAVLIVDTDKLDTSLFHADEDAVEQASRMTTTEMVRSGRLAEFVDKINPNVKRWSMSQRTRWFRNRLDVLASGGFGHEWSLIALGTCSYHASVPADAIVGMIEWHEHRDIMEMALIFDPTITVTNYKLLGREHRYLMQEFARVDTGHTLPPYATRTEMIMPHAREVFNRPSFIRTLR